MEIIAIIPARYNSKRFPGKPLAKIAGKTMIEHVYQRVKQVKDIEAVIVATDDQRIYKTVQAFGGQAQMTSSEHRSGTDRVAEVACELNSEIVVNVQGDEPLIEPAMIAQAIQPFYFEDNLKMSTLKKKIETEAELKNPNVVKVVTDKDDNALYFSRSLLPYPRASLTVSYKHVGLYVYDRQFLIQFSKMAPTPLEKTESLEQLRVLENGHKIKVVETSFNTIGVDTCEDIKKVERVLEQDRSMKLST